MQAPRRPTHFTKNIKAKCYKVLRLASFKFAYTLPLAYPTYISDKVAIN
jgi:hypothetical protein